MKRLFFGLFAVAFCCALQFPAAADAAQTEKVLHAFAGAPDGFYSFAGLINVNGTLYGTTRDGGLYEGGTVFAIDPGTGTEAVLYSFCSQDLCTDCSGPVASLVDVKGTLYGTTEFGGSNCKGGYVPGCGTVFSVNPKTGAAAVIYSFCSQEDCADGELPMAGLIDVNGTLYGTTEFGGSNCPANSGCGTVFSIDPKTGTETVLHSFGSGADGKYPEAGLTDVNGTLYGTTDDGGGSNTNCYYGCGTVFSLDPATGAETVVYSLCTQQNCTDGQYPLAGVVDVKGALYGTTYGGGTNCTEEGDCGTVFALDPKTGVETVLHSFGAGTDGYQPLASLVDVKGILYGTTEFGGSNTKCDYGSSCGTVFSVDPATGAETVVYSFCSRKNCTDGNAPQAPLIDVKGTLYGTTQFGSNTSCDYGCGTVFAIRDRR